MADRKNHMPFLECPNKHNCVSSESNNPLNYIKPLAITGDPDQYWKKLDHLIQSIPRFDIVERNKTYIHVEARSRIFGFTDDMEFHLKKDKEYIAVRSFSRVGKWDFGVNRRRVEMIRKSLYRK